MLIYGAAVSLCLLSFAVSYLSKTPTRLNSIRRFWAENSRSQVLLAKMPLRCCKKYWTQTLRNVSKLKKFEQVYGSNLISLFVWIKASLWATTKYQTKKWYWKCLTKKVFKKSMLWDASMPTNTTMLLLATISYWRDWRGKARLKHLSTTNQRKLYILSLWWYQKIPLFIEKIGRRTVACSHAVWLRALIEIKMWEALKQATSNKEEIVQIIRLGLNHPEITKITLRQWSLLLPDKDI